MRQPLTTTEKKLRDVERSIVPDGHLTVNQLIKRLQEFADQPHYTVPAMITPCQTTAGYRLDVLNVRPNGHTDKNCKLCRGL